MTDAEVALIKQEYSEDVPNWIVRRMEESAAIDPNSTAFRYGHYGMPIDAANSPIGCESYVSLPHLKAAMRALNTALVPVVFEIGMIR